MKNKIKIYCLILVLSALCGVLASCGKDAYVPSGYKSLTEAKIGYKVYVPSEWTDDISTGVVTAYVSEKDRSNISFMAFEIDNTVINASVVTGAAETADTAYTEADPAANTEAATSGDGKVPEIATLDEYWSYYSGELKKTFPDVEYQTAGENTLLSKQAAKKYVYTATVTGTQYKFMQVVAIKAGTVYLFTYTALPENYDAHLEDVEKILGYIEITG